MASLTILNQGSSTNITGLSPVSGAVSTTDEVMIYDASAAGNRKATVQELVPDGFLSADSTGRAKMADGFVNAAKVASASLTADKMAIPTVVAWVNFDGTGTPTIKASFNVASITDNGVGDYTINFTNALADANYAVSGVAGGAGNMVSLAGAYSSPPTVKSTTACRVITANYAGQFDGVNTSVMFIR